MFRLSGLMASLGLLVLVGAARADHKEPANDREFVEHMAKGGNAEVKLGELAERRAGNEKVKAFAARMVKDHSEANKKLMDAAKNLKVAVAPGLDEEMQKHFMEMSKLQGDDFDKHYAKMMAEDHDKAVALVEKFSKMAQDAEVKKWCEESLPVLREHQKMAKDLNDTVNKK